MVICRCFLRIRLPPISTLTDTLLPHTTLVRSVRRRAVQVGEVAAPAAGDADLLRRPGGLLQQQHAPPAPASLDCSHEAGRPRAEDDDIEVAQHCHSTGKGPSAQPSAWFRLEPPPLARRPIRSSPAARRATPSLPSRRGRPRTRGLLDGKTEVGKRK